MVSKPYVLNISSRELNLILPVCLYVIFLPEDQRDNLGYKSLNPQIISEVLTIRGHPLANMSSQLIKMPVRQQGEIPKQAPFWKAMLLISSFKFSYKAAMTT